jgi:hypothetical protein
MPLNAQRVKASLNKKAAMHLLLRVAIALESNEISIARNAIRHTTYRYTHHFE